MVTRETPTLTSELWQSPMGVVVDDEIELISDGDGLAVIGDPAVVDRFLSSAGVQSKDLRLTPKIVGALRAGSGVAQAASQVAAHSGRWVKLTEESAQALKLGGAMKGSSGALSRAIAKGADGKISKILEFTTPGSMASMLTNPAALAGAAGIMAQLAKQQTMDEITDYLAVIDEKVDDILRAQKDAAVSEMIGVGIVIDEAMLKREHVGRVSEVTWSSLHGAAQTIASTQAYALRRLDAWGEKMEKNSDIGDLARLTDAADDAVNEWLAVIARCFQLQDALDVLELDRVLDVGTADLDRHRVALRAAREHRRSVVSITTIRLLTRIATVAEGANKRVLRHPRNAGKVVRAGNEVVADIGLFHGRHGIDASRDAVEATSWSQAAADVRDDAFGVGEQGIQAARRLSRRTIDGARTGTGKVAAAAATHVPWGRPDRWQAEVRGAPTGTDDDDTDHESEELERWISGDQGRT